jgi:hypothetical protein
MDDGDISTVFFGETHNDATDQARVTAYMNALDEDLTQPTLTVFERGLLYPTGALTGHYVREEDLTTSSNAPLGVVVSSHPGNWGFALSINQRSMVTAGYIALSIADEANQAAKERIVIFFGAEHSNLVTVYLEYLYQHVVPWVKPRKRIDLIICSTQG